MTFSFMRKLKVPFHGSSKSKEPIIIITFRFEALAKLNRYYFVKQTRDFCTIADALEGIENLSLQDQYIFSQAPLKLPSNTRKIITRLDVLKSFAEQFSSLSRVTLPKEYHLGHHMFSRETDLQPYEERDLDLYERVHNSKSNLRFLNRIRSPWGVPMAWEQIWEGIRRARSMSGLNSESVRHYRFNPSH